MIYAAPGELYPFTCEAPAGVAADLRVRIEDDDDVVVVAEVGGVVEFAAGQYRRKLEVPSSVGVHAVIWRRVSTGAEVHEPLEVTSSGDPPVAGPEPGHYVSLGAIRLELGLAADDDERLSDAAAAKLRRTAEMLVDVALAGRPVGADGRKVAADAVEAWRWTRLQEAVTCLAARLHRNPDLLGPRFNAASGPDFSYSGPIGPVFGHEAQALLASTGLIPTRARMARRR